MGLRVLLVRDPPDVRRLSMERFADELIAQLGDDPSLDVDTFALGATAGCPDRAAPADRYVRRFVRYPLGVRRRRADLYHLLDHSEAQFGALVPRERLVATCHDLMLLRAEVQDIGFRGHRLQVRRFRWSTGFLRRAARVICISEATRRDAVELVGVAPERTVVVPLGLDHGRFRPLDADGRAAAREALGLTGPTLMHVSTGAGYKNNAGTLRVLARVRRGGVDARLVRAGRPLSAADRRLADELGVLDRVDERPLIADDELARLYAAADVLLFPSHHEGFGWPALEAMASGTPVVASRAPSLVEVTGGAADLADARDDAGLARLVERVLTDDRHAADLRRRGLERAAQFDWARTAAGVRDVYRSVAS